MNKKYAISDTCNLKLIDLKTNKVLFETENYPSDLIAEELNKQYRHTQTQLQQIVNKPKLSKIGIHVIKQDNWQEQFLKYVLKHVDENKDHVTYVNINETECVIKTEKREYIKISTEELEQFIDMKTQKYFLELNCNYETVLCL